MPNHVINILKIKTKNPNEVFKKFGEENFDFNKVIPMPDYIYKGDIGEKERNLYGENNWYDWSNKYWGTKWNAYDQCEPYVEGNYVTYVFSTAWSCPLPIYQELAKKYDIEVKYADEDIGSNCGRIKSKDGKIIEHKTEEDFTDPEGYAKRVWGW